MPPEPMHMTIEELIKKIQDELEDLPLQDLAPGSCFREIDGWSSLHGLILMALVSTEFNVDLSGRQIAAIRTVQDLYDAMVGAA